MRKIKLDEKIKYEFWIVSNPRKGTCKQIIYCFEYEKKIPTFRDLFKRAGIDVNTIDKMEVIYLIGENALDGKVYIYNNEEKKLIKNGRTGGYA